MCLYVRIRSTLSFLRGAFDASRYDAEAWPVICMWAPCCRMVGSIWCGQLNNESSLYDILLELLIRNVDTTLWLSSDTTTMLKEAYEAARQSDGSKRHQNIMKSNTMHMTTNIYTDWRNVPYNLQLQILISFD